MGSFFENRHFVYRSCERIIPKIYVLQAEGKDVKSTDWLRIKSNDGIGFCVVELYHQILSQKNTVSYSIENLETPIRPPHLLSLVLTKINPWSRVLPAKQTGRQLDKKFPALYGT
jgi:hypothetical protein